MRTESSSESILGKSFAVIATLLGGALCLGGCAASTRDLKHSMTAYETGNFHKASQRCEAIDESDLDGKKQVRYLVYCGLAYYKTGDMDAARSLLVSGQKAYGQGDPSWLKPLIVDEMNKAMLDLSGGARPAQPPVSLSSQGVSRADDVE